MEDWMLDDNEEAADAINVMAETLETAKRQTVVDNADYLIKVMAYMSSPRALRLLVWFDTHFGENVSVDLTAFAAETKHDPCSVLFLDRFETLHRLDLLSTLFHPRRTRLIAEILQDDVLSNQD